MQYDLSSYAEILYNAGCWYLKRCLKGPKAFIGISIGLFNLPDVVAVACNFFLIWPLGQSARFICKIRQVTLTHLTVVRYV